MDTELYLLKAIQTSLKAGTAILDVYNSNFNVEHKADSSPITLADKRSHDIIIAELRQFQIPILSEEGRDIPYEERKTWNKLWIVDPLDGTKEFVKRNGEFTVNIALVVDGKPCLGVILVPVKGILYYAVQDMGAYRLENGRIIELLRKESREGEESGLLNNIINHSTKLPTSQAATSPFTITGSRSHTSPELERFVEEKRREYGNVEFVSAGSSLKFCLVAEGKADMYPRFGTTMEWDTAAGQAIAENAGTAVLDFHADISLIYNKKNLQNPWFIVKKPEFRKPIYE